MSGSLMILPSSDFELIRLVRIPEDFEQHEVYRHVTGLIAEVEERNPGCGWAQIADTLEDHGFETVEFIMGPAIG